MEQTLRTINWNYASARNITGKGITIAYLDTGISLHHDFMKPTRRVICFRDFVNRRSYPYDDNGHGTHVAGIGSSSKFGVAPGSNIVALKVLNRNGTGKFKNMIRCFQWILNNKDTYQIRIVNVSIGMPETNDPFKTEELISWVNQLWDAGLIVCIAGGNLGPEPQSITIPGTSHKIITVGSSDDRYDKNYSGQGPTKNCVIKPDLTAPGTNILSCYGASHYIEKSGTSMATPIVSGAIALYLEQHPATTNKMMKLKLRSSCDDLGYPPNKQGWGRINIQKLLVH